MKIWLHYFHGSGESAKSNLSVFGVILVSIFLAFSHIRTEYGEILRISPYSVRMRENAGKMQKRITPNTDTFFAVAARSHFPVLALYEQGIFISIVT